MTMAVEGDCIGIMGMELYFPRNHVEQAELGTRRAIDMNLNDFVVFFVFACAVICVFACANVSFPRSLVRSFTRSLPRNLALSTPDIVLIPWLS